MEVLDERWFEALRNINESEPELEWLTHFLRISAEEKVRFFQDDIENPKFIYLNKGNDERTLDRYRALSDAIEKSESNEIVRSLYQEKITAQMHRVEMMNASRKGDDKRFFELSVKVYGKPKKKNFSLIAKHIQKLAEQAYEPSQAGAAKRLGKLFSKIDVSRTAMSHDILPPLVEDGDEEIVSAVQVAQIFQSVLDRYDITGWSVRIDPTGHRTRFSVSATNRTVNIPSDAHLGNRARPLTANRALAIGEHEVGVHVRRAFEGGQQPLRLLGVGLQGYLRGEEGLASYVQQQIEGASEYYGFDRYLAIAVAMGMDGTQRDFRGVYMIVRDYYTLALPPDTGEERLNSLAWDLCVRIFRGTTGQSAGLIYTRDQVYFEGNVGIWELLIERPHVFEQLFIGKFDPMARKHVEALVDLGMLTQW